MLLPVLKNALKNQVITEEGKKFIGDFNNYYEYWVSSFNDRFFTMGTFIRLGSEIENCLKHYYMSCKGHKNLLDLKADPRYSNNIFQRVQSWNNNGVINLYKEELGYDLGNNTKIKEIQELMMNRHLFAHNSGLLDEEYIINIKKITGVDLIDDPYVKQNYPMNDVYWFEPLNNLNQYIEDTKAFFREFP